MISYKIKKYALISAIILVLCLLVGVLIWSSLNNDVASAHYVNSNDLGTIAFPYTSYNTSLISSNFVGSDFGYHTTSASVTIPTIPTTISNGNMWFDSGSEVNTTFSYKNYSYMNYDYCGFYTTKMFDSGNSWVNLFFRNLNLSAGQPYTISFILSDIVTNITETNNPYVYVYYRNFATSSSPIGIGYVSVANVYDNSNDGYLLWSYTFTPNDAMDCVWFRLYVGGTYNFYLTKGEHPIFYDYSSNYKIGRLSFTQNGNTTANTFDFLFNFNFNGMENVSGGSISAFSFGDSNLLSYSYILQSLKLYQYSITPIVTLSVSSLYIPVSLSYNSLSETTTLYGNYIKFSGTGMLSSSASVVVNMYIYDSGYWEVSLTTTNSGIRYQYIWIDFYQNVSSGLISATDFQLGYETAVKDLQEDINNARTIGYQEGLRTADNSTFFGLLSAVVEAPLNAVMSIFDFDILGYNMKSLYLSLISLALVLFCIKFIVGNIGGNSD